MTELTDTEKDTVRKAREAWESDDLQIDFAPTIAWVDGNEGSTRGAWVQAWVWVAN